VMKDIQVIDWMKIGMKGQKTIMETAPLHIDNDMLGHDALDIPSPTCKYS
jgi:hypothetical protein